MPPSPCPHLFLEFASASRRPDRDGARPALHDGIKRLGRHFPENEEVVRRAEGHAEDAEIPPGLVDGDRPGFRRAVVGLAGERKFLLEVCDAFVRSEVLKLQIDGETFHQGLRGSRVVEGSRIGLAAHHEFDLGRAHDAHHARNAAPINALLFDMFVSYSEL